MCVSMCVQLCPTLCVRGFSYVRPCVSVFSCVRFSAIPWTVACQAFLFTDFSRQEVRCHFLSQGDLPDPGIQPESPALAGGFFTTEPPGKPFLDFSLTCKNYNTTDSEMKQSSVLPKKSEKGKKRTEEVRRKKEKKSSSRKKSPRGKNLI